MKKDHGILQPLQCISCSKRYSNYQTLGVHRREFCKGGRNAETGTYTLSSFFRVIENLMPSFGDILMCTGGTVIYNDCEVGEVPKNLSNIFIKFLQNGTIHARIAGTLFDRGYGLEIPVDYIFNGDTERLYKLIDDLKQDPEFEAASMNLNDNAVGHSLSQIPRTEKKITQYFNLLL